MPTYKPNTPEGDNPNARPQYNEELEIEDNKSAGFLDLLAPFWRTENPIGKELHRQDLQEEVQTEDPTLTNQDFKRDTSFDAVQQAIDDGYNVNKEDFSFIGQSKSRADYEVRVKQLESQKNDINDISKGGFWTQLAAGTTVGAADPTTYIPGGAFVKGASVANNALRITGTALASSSTREAYLQTQGPRTAEESVLNVAGETVFAGFLGTAFSAIAKGADTSDMINNLTKEIAGQETRNQLIYETPNGKDINATGSRQTKNFEEFEGTLKDDNGQVLGALPDYDDLELTNRQNNYQTSNVFSKLIKSNKGDAPEWFLNKIGFDKKLPYGKRVNKAIKDFIDYGNPSDSVRAKRLTFFRDFERQYVFNQYAKAADVQRGIDPEEVVVRAENRDQVLTMSLNQGVDADVYVPEIIRLCD